MRKIISILLFFFSFAHANELENLKSYLNKYDVIHLAVSYAPGLGHQMATIRVYEHLREFGYQGHVEIVWDDEKGVGTVSNKLKKLYPKFNEKKEYQQIREKNISFISYTKFMRKVFSEPSLVISGGGDYIMFMGGKYRLSLQPSGWKNNSVLFTPGQYYHFEDKNMNVRIEFPTEERIFENIDDLFDESNLEFYSKIKYLIKNRKNVRFMPIYGPNYNNEGQQLSNILSSLKLTQERVEKQRPMVMKLFYNLKDEHRKTIEQNHPDVKFLNLFDPDFYNAYLGLKADEVAIIEIGPVAPAIFDFFYYKASLPMIGAGKNAENLMRNIGKPYLMLTDKYDILQRWPRLKQMYKRIHRELDSKNTRFEQLTKFMLDSIDKRSDMSTVFREGSERYRKKDKIKEALLKLAEVDADKVKQTKASGLRHCLVKLLNAALIRI